ncbi:MAG: EAL domain-containing protein [Pseudomonadota bacterium]
MNDLTLNADAEQPLRVLLVDDDSVDRRIISRCLKKSGLTVEVKETFEVEEVERLARSGEYSCVLMDFRLPGGESFELFQSLFSESCEERAGIVLLTGRGDERIAAEAIQRGAQEYLPKAELTPVALRRAIEVAMEKASLSQQLAQRDKQLHRMSFYDSLTGLPNRQLYMDRLEQQFRHASRDGEEFAVLMMDLNGFKQINDSFGHQVGDELLVETAKRLKGAMRESDSVARLGGDEFAALLPKTGSVSGCQSVAEKIRRAFAGDLIIDGNAHRVGIAVGAAIYPRHGTSPAELLQTADLAMYEAKRDRAQELVCGPGKASEDFRQTAVLDHLDGALKAEDQLFLVYQPKLCLESGQTVGVEALLRWQHPTLGLVAPKEILPAAQRSATALVNLTQKTLDLALRQASAWADAGRPAELSVNLSASLLQQPAAARQVCDWLADQQTNAGQLCLEITEDALLPDPHGASDIMKTIAALGFAISIDDFGSGFSSLKLLRDLPISELKIDRPFVKAAADQGDSSVVDSVISLGRCFDARVVAEGIEDQRIQDQLVSRGCRFGQGFHLASPMTAAELDSWWTHQRSTPVLFQAARLRRLPVQDPALGAAWNDPPATSERGFGNRRSSR